MVILSESRMWQYWDDDHREDAPHFSRFQKTSIFLKIGNFKNFVTLAIPEFKQTIVSLLHIRISIAKKPKQTNSAQR